MRATYKKLLVLFALVLGSAAACAAPTALDDGEDDLAFPGGKADSGYSDCELGAVVDELNALPLSSFADEAAARDALRAKGVHSSAARCLVWYRLGLDTNVSCPSQLPAGAVAAPREFQSIEEVDAVKWVGPQALSQLVDAIGDACVEPPPPSGGPNVDVVFSPTRDVAASHAGRISAMMDAAEHSIDIAMYSFSESTLKAAVLRNAGRVQIRVLYDKSHLGGGLETTFENAGIEVRFVGQTMHHKFVVIDGVQVETHDPMNTKVASGSANWSSGAVTTYDESTLFIERSPEMALRYQREFNLLWAYSQPVEGHDEIPHVETMEITDAMIDAVDDPTVDAIFTSQNFKITSRGLTAQRDGYDVADRFIEKIEQAEHSIWLFSERLRSVPVAEALMRKAAERPDVEIRVYLDNQEYVSSSTSAGLMRDLMECYATASTTSQRINCEDGMYYSYEATQAFGDSPNHELRMKYYSYNWHYSFPQMHQKTMLVDGRWLLTGSYNLSENAEFSTFENVMIYDGQAYPQLIAAFESELDRLWNLNTDQYDGLMNRVTGTATQVPIQFEPIAMTWQQVDDYRTATRDACSHAQLSDLRMNNDTARWCTRQ